MEVWCAFLLLIDPFAMVRVREKWLHIFDLCWKTVPTVISLLILVEFGCSWFSAFSGICLLKNDEQLHVWSIICLASFQNVFGASTIQWARATACIQSDVVLASGISITKMPLAYLIYIIILFLFHFIFIWCHELRKIIEDSFLIQFWWDFLHNTSDDV